MVKSYTFRFLRNAATALERFTAGHCCPLAVQVAAVTLRDYFAERAHCPARLDSRQLAKRAERAGELAELSATVADLLD